MPVVKQPLNVSCFQCQKSLLVKFVPPHKGYSKKNNWEYYTEKEENKDKYICNKCLENLYKNRKWVFLEQIKSLKKRQKVRNYIHGGLI